MPDVARSLQRTELPDASGHASRRRRAAPAGGRRVGGFSPGNVHLIEVLKTRVGPDVIPAILDAGFSLDFVDPMTLAHDTAVEGRQLRVGGQRYSAVVLPNIERVSPETMQLLEAFARAGGTVLAVGTKPSRAPGLKATAADRETVAAVSRRLFDGSARLVTEPHESVRRSDRPQRRRRRVCCTAARHGRGPSPPRDHRSVLRGQHVEPRATHRGEFRQPRGIVRNGGIPRQER